MPEEDIKKEVPKYSTDNLPKTKEEWNQLRETDVNTYADLTQHNFDRLFKEKKELEEKTVGLETQRNNLTVELENYRKKSQEPVVTPKISEEPIEKEYSIHNLPKSKEEWENLMIEDPVLGTDLRTYYQNQINQDNTRFEEAQAESRKSVQEEHPDMYFTELDTNGQPLKDSQGKVVLKVDSNTGEPIFNPNSEKGKLWLDIFNENNVRNPDGTVTNYLVTMPNGPKLLMSEMERRLRSKGEKMVQEANQQREQKIQEGQIISEGITPPQKVDVTFSNDEEREHAEKMVRRGVYPNLEEYVKNRDSKEVGIYEENRFPTFGN